MSQDTITKNKILAVDFDGTCVRHEFPGIGEDVPHAVEVLKALVTAGVKIIVWTMRSGEYLEVDARQWFEERGIEVWAYNANPEQSGWTTSPKCYAQVYVDDAALGCPLIYPENGARPFVDWKTVEKKLLEMKYL